MRDDAYTMTCELISRLTNNDRSLLIEAAQGSALGGAPLNGEFRNKAAKLGLCFRSTGRLKPIVLAMARADAGA